ncbi:Crp/Fnr family transcriptional regulator [Paraburkholderia sp. J67]|uniref:Crp/Fnr family transcriptional regulator n=1 Tax=Paraburkholderia sp. J67 TaxID=2805435 RepID=UPI002ABE30F8|nr:Crp/Fnr family transcriptional regulator [Paraburkholderia sp. J67]
MNQPSQYPELAANPWFSTLDDEIRLALIAQSQVLNLQRGNAVWHRSDRSNGLYCLLDGAVQVSATSWSGRELLLNVVYPVNWFGEVSMLDEGGRTHEVFATSDSRLLHVPRARLELICAKHPLLWRALARLMAGKLRAAYANLEEVCLLPAVPRLASRLLALMQQNADRQSPARIALSQEELAMMLSLSRQTINKALGELESAGAIVARYGTIEVRDEALLRQLAQA